MPCLNSTVRPHARPRHGLRIGPLAALRWDQMDLKMLLFHVARLKRGLARATHPLRGPSFRRSAQLEREQRPSAPSIFTTSDVAR